MMIDKERALAHVLQLLSVEGPSGREQKVVETLKQLLIEAGCRSTWMRTDDAHRRLGPGYETGNLIVQLPGRIKAPRILFSAHMDTVPLCRGAVPQIRGNRIVSKGGTGLGGDDRSGCAAMVTLAQTLLQQNLPHPPITLLFPIAEENGLNGSRMVRFKDLGHPVMGFNLDGQEPNEIVIGAMGAVRWTAEITGRSSHAGLEPHKGISAALIAARAIADIQAKGYFGRIEKGRCRGTSNVGSMVGGEADNQVMDRLLLTGECRSHSPGFLDRIVRVYRTAFERAASQTCNDTGRSGSVRMSVKSSYRAFRLNRNEPCVRIATQAVIDAGLSPNPLIMDAGLDANNFNEKGLPTVTLGTGSHRFHTVDEYVDIREYLTACTVLLKIAARCC